MTKRAIISAAHIIRNRATRNMLRHIKPFAIPIIRIRKMLRAEAAAAAVRAAICAAAFFVRIVAANVWAEI